MRLSRPLISVLIPAHNAEAHLADTLACATNQTWSPREIIVVDDGSWDATAQIALRYQGVRLIRQQNAGAPAARNRAFAASHGAFVLFLDADDLIPPCHLAALHAAIASTPDCVALGQWDRFHDDPAEACFPRRTTYVDASGPEWIALDWAFARPMTQCGMALIPRQLIERYGGWDETLSGCPNDDFEFFARLISKSFGVRFANDARLYYRSGFVGSLSGKSSRDSARNQLRSLLMGTEHLLNAEDSPQNRRLSANILQDFEFSRYPAHSDLRILARERITELGGADIRPDGPPGFQKLRPWIGWRAARRVQLLAERWRLNRAGRTGARRVAAG